MTFFLSGGAKCGKSGLAQRIALSLAGDGPRYYVATLIPTGAEDQERIRLHLEDRAGMGFQTVECFTDVMDCLRYADPRGTFLVDSVTSLIQNALFPAERNYEMDPEGAMRCADSLVQFARTVDNAVFVSDYIYAEPVQYSASTEEYRKILAAVDRRLAGLCDTVIEMTAGQPTIHKGELKL
ncbi:MAG: bifunctional adenosylcobinamide kinase/adenosylcobinamide-phosphate guanylyltransferase [Oscillospiraceae bacterium]|nr:bifunctional adenosylcobinamide kinase/adenosylcobinamide-phosphate guanylyltransferase [Oscillospiraceae bacterium]MBR2889977.1 bifunctional adenosylcobinamide kinase/adenosylcobinamide-phosphate guanylyltransferase [Oscillospiraceae bacterium]